MLLLEQFESLTLHPKNAAKLKELILQLGAQGKLTRKWREQNSNVEPASELLKRIRTKKAQLVKGKKLKKEQEIKYSIALENQDDIPNSWAKVKMYEILFITKLAGFEYTKYLNLQDTGEVPVIRAQNVRPLKLDITNLKYIDKETSNLLNRCALTKPSLLMTFIGAGVGDTALFDKEERWHLAPNVAKLEPFDGCEKDINLKFLNYFLLSKTGKNEVFKHLKSTAQPSLSMGTIRDIDLPLPPLAEQEAIVARVEELMHKMEELEQQTKERIQLKKDLGSAALQQLTTAADEDLDQQWHFLKQHFQTLFDEEENVKKLRETILQLAVQGKLTSSWRKYHPNTEPASELLKRIQAEKAQLVKEKKIKKEKPLEPISEDAIPYELPEGWIWCRLGSLTNLITSGSRDWAKYYSTEGAKFIRMGNLSKGSFDLRLNNIQYVAPPNDTEGNRTKLEENDILISITGEVGMLGLIPADFGDAYINQHTALVRFNTLIVHKYVAYTFLSQLMQEQFNEPQRGIKNSFRLSDIDNLIFPLPPHEEQFIIVNNAEQLFELCNKLNQQIQQSKKEADTLMQAVVQEALQVKEEIEL